MLRSWILVIFILLSLFFLYVFTDLYFAFLALSIFILLIISSILLLFIHKRTLRLTVRSSWSTYKLDEGTIYLNIQNNNIFPIMKMECTFLFHNRLTNEKSKKELFLTAKAKENIDVPIQFISEQVGEIVVEIIDVQLYDYFNLCAFTIPCESNTSVFVLPTYFNIQFEEEDAESGLEHKQAFQSDQKNINGTEMIGLKEYTEDENAK